jgi:hypothetical protein
MNHAAKARVFELYSKYVWPIHRSLSFVKLADRCKRCALSEKASTLESGLCEYCRSDSDSQSDKESSDQNFADGLKGLESEFDEVIKLACGSGRNQYDAVLMLSGGKDSAWLLHHLKETYPKLRLLCLIIDSGFLNPVARSNAEELVAKLKVDYMLFRPEPEVFQKPLSLAFENAKQQGCSGAVDVVDGDLLHDIGRHIAAQQAIPIVLSGVSWAQVEDIFGVEHYAMPEQRENSRRTSSGPMNLLEALDESSRRYWWNPDLYPKENVAKFLFPFYVWRKSEEDIIAEVISLGLIKKSKSSPLVTNNAMITLMGVVDVLNIGYSSFEPEFCKMIRQGKASLDVWRNIFALLEYCSKTGFLIKPEAVDALNRLHLKGEDLNIPWC